MKSHLDIIVLGAGFSGIGLGVKLLEAGKRNFAILEQADDIGGTWRDNTYPGSGCDTESHLYCFSFAPHPTVSRMYARQPEILAYMKRIVDDNGLRPFIRLGAKVTSVVWDDEALLWNVSLADGSVLTARNFVAAWGQLNRPQVPVIKGQDAFEGVQFHSARWRHDIDLSGKRVASIGNAASAVQYIPEIAPVVGHLDVFQRSPNWVVPRMDRPYSEKEIEEYSTVPGLFAKHRQELFEWRETTFLRMKQGSAEAQELERVAMEHLNSQVPDPELRKKLTPDYPLGCKRILRSDDYFPALVRDNVSLITSGISRFKSDGIVTADGAFHPVDVVIYGTGFETQSFQGPVEVSGREGQSLRDVWKEGAYAYLGMCVSGFPNFFVMYGPNTNLGHNSILSMLEIQFDYVLQALAAQDQSGVKALEVRPAVVSRFNAELQREMDDAAWSGGCNSWYKNAAGKVINNWSGTVHQYQDKARHFVRDEYIALPAGGTV
ncbi:NAD(P)/FAD-dependent oxidoreductase [Burkholderia multivorans]|uniref:flavin-containing monooxygenase n=1 Tax=Burkholderia multivorans TaxID=87883 RepID=UPI002018BE24|nr:NAD(P)/FAD-dependent oxidoreductase [Burkholderia multivorans]MCO1374652.1 NAD(P)/FAD-dependent oxidoreductase [Burkholderia multivorans]MCO1459794.1 NAD(P)/FAD-dependent oxidoreductase [Burkholderia multivorans]UQO21203.1 NAD(P)/FAD-dependent oxidoreductase [Burkholderia multivorans]UQO87465.1 NAD(P)/FAD-dependent oxidoreductase [Burkholderia multivorans]HEM7843248.1 NAD(P)/FAD-dependent oxidoreductase [Burkholderia multivorans]